MRSRNIKPGFFKNEVLAEINPLGRILFAGLWCMADRKGRLEDRPKRIRAEILPYDKCNMDRLLADLDRAGFIHRYSINGNKFIQITNFLKHQTPHMKEAESTIPAPDLHRESTGSDPDNPDKSPADSFNLIPDSLNPHSDSREGEKVGAERSKNQFNLFWGVYPKKKGGKEKSWEIWQQRVKDGTLPLFNILIGATRKLIESSDWEKDEGRFIPKITTFLEEGRWTDAEDLGSSPELLPPDPDCPKCKGDGYEIFIKEGIERARNCECLKALPPGPDCPYCLSGGIEIMEENGNKKVVFCRCRRTTDYSQTQANGE